MPLPFTHDQFLDLFGAYNRALWPAAALLWLVTAAVLFSFWRRGHAASRAMSAMLVVHWAWSGIVYHLIYFRTINSGAVVFGAMFLVQAALLVWLGVAKQRLRFERTGSTWSAIGSIIVAFSLAYPAIGLLFGLEYPRLPLFAVPCPTTILTIGMLLWTSPRDARRLAVIPVLWAVIGGSAAILLAIRADFAMMIAALVLVVFVVRKTEKAASRERAVAT